jgi:hypothetical protein
MTIIHWCNNEDLSNYDDNDDDDNDEGDNGDEDDNDYDNEDDDDDDNNDSTPTEPLTSGQTTSLEEKKRVPDDLLYSDIFSVVVC